MLPTSLMKWPHSAKGACCAAEDGRTAAEVFKEAIMDKTDALAGEGDALAELEHVACIFPRGRYDLSIFPSFMLMDGQNFQFKIRCVLPLGLCIRLRPGTVEGAPCLRGGVEVHYEPRASNISRLNCAVRQGCNVRGVPPLVETMPHPQQYRVLTSSSMLCFAGFRNKPYAP